jgi:hypothetical protein
MPAAPNRWRTVEPTFRTLYPSPLRQFPDAAGRAEVRSLYEGRVEVNADKYHF